MKASRSGRPVAKRSRCHGHVAPARSPLVEVLGRRRRGLPSAPCAGGLADLFHGRLAADVRPGPVAGAGHTGGPPGLANRVLPRLHLQRDGPAAGDELPQPPAIPAEAEAEDARGHDGDLAVNRRPADRRADRRRGGAHAPGGDAGGRGQGAGVRRQRASKYAVLKDSGVQGEGRRAKGEAASKAEGKPQNPRANRRARARPTIPTPRSRPTARGRRAGKGGSGRSKSGAAQGKPSGSKDGQQGKSGACNDQAKDAGKAGEKSEAQGKAQDGRSEEKARGQEKSESDERKDRERARKVVRGESGSERLVEPGAEAAVVTARCPWTGCGRRS